MEIIKVIKVHMKRQQWWSRQEWRLRREIRLFFAQVAVIRVRVAHFNKQDYRAAKVNDSYTKKRVSQVKFYPKFFSLLRRVRQVNRSRLGKIAEETKSNRKLQKSPKPSKSIASKEAFQHPRTSKTSSKSKTHLWTAMQPQGISTQHLSKAW